jgi:hypothetical protein
MLYGPTKSRALIQNKVFAACKALKCRPKYRRACGRLKKMKMTRTNAEWVARVSILRPGRSI